MKKERFFARHNQFWGCWFIYDGDKMIDSLRYEKVSEDQFTSHHEARAAAMEMNYQLEKAQ